VTRVTMPGAGTSRRPGSIQPALAVAAILVLLPPLLVALVGTSKPAPLTKDSRLAFIRSAQVWSPTPVPAMDVRTGPGGPGAFAPDAVVTCDYKPHDKRGGASQKFDCAIDAHDVAKVRYGDGNGEVEGSVLASRLLWALGFGAARVYPVRVVCRGCSPDPWKNPERADGEATFDPAVIERAPLGDVMGVQDDDDDLGWSWSELAQVQESQGGATLAERDALTLLAVMIQHTDSKPEQQDLLCRPGGVNEDGICEKPFLMLHDVGLTFGHGNLWNTNSRSSVNFAEWARTPVWRDHDACIGHMSKSHTGTLGDPPISEAGRAFLANLLQQLTDTQLRDLFEVSRVDRRQVDPSTPPASVDDWVAAFKQKREEIVTNRCPAAVNITSEALTPASGGPLAARSTAPRH
jgi:hypothetical protein